MLGSSLVPLTQIYHLKMQVLAIQQNPTALIALSTTSAFVRARRQVS